jgi:flagellar assembly protein FliH
VEKVVYGQAAIEQEMVKRAIIEALRVVPEPVHVQISVNPKDYEYIETVKEDFFSSIQALKDVTVTPDPAIHQGGCNVRTKFGEVDATIESRLEAIRECLLTANGKKAVPK